MYTETSLVKSEMPYYGARNTEYGRSQNTSRIMAKLFFFGLFHARTLPRKPIEAKDVKADSLSDGIQPCIICKFCDFVSPATEADFDLLLGRINHV
jgi:hypothetical protein